MNSMMFFSTGNDPFAHIRKHLTEVPAASFDGLWATIELQPDLFALQRFSVGVVVGTADGGFAFRLLSETKKFECIYDKALALRVRSLIDSAEHTLQRAMRDRIPFAQLRFETDNLTLSTPWPTSGPSPEATLSRLYFEVVAMEPTRNKPEREFVAMDTEQVRLMVNNELKRIGGLKYNRLVIEPKEVVLKDDLSGEIHTLDLSLRTDRGAGSVLSAVYKTPSTIELNLLRASRDLAIYGRVRHIEDLALFVMSARPSQLDPIEYGRIAELLDEQSWRLERQGFRVVVADDAPQIAEQIYDWAALAD